MWAEQFPVKITLTKHLYNQYSVLLYCPSKDLLLDFNPACIWKILVISHNLLGHRWTKFKMLNQKTKFAVLFNIAGTPADVNTVELPYFQLVHDQIWMSVASIQISSQMFTSMLQKRRRLDGKRRRVDLDDWMALQVSDWLSVSE